MATKPASESDWTTWLYRDHTPPADGCGTWQALYAGTRKLTDDVMAHVSLENNVLFPRFGA